MTESQPVPDQNQQAEPSQRQQPRWRRLKRALRVVGTILLIVLIVGWWRVLRIVEHDNWPPPADAVTSDQALEMTQSFIAKGDARRGDVAIAYAPSTASDVQFFLDGSTFFPEMYADIESAEHSIHLLMFGFTPGGWGDDFSDLLIRKAGDGVEVRLIVDSQGSKAVSDNDWFFENLAAGGVQIVVNDTLPLQTTGEIPKLDRTWRQDEVGRSDHRKMMVIDGHIGWVGGAGLEDHFDNGGWIDTFVRVEGDIVRQLQAVFCTSFHAYGGDLPTGLGAYFPEPENAGDIRTTILQNIPGGFVPGTQASQEVIENASERIDVLNAYFTDAGMINRLIEASERGVDVRVVGSQESNVFPAQYAFLSQYERLQNAGVEIWETPGVMHAKVTVADDTVIIGSINYDAWALYRNLEMALMFEDPETADQARELIVEPTVANATSGERPDGWRETVPANFWWWLRYFL